MAEMKAPAAQPVVVTQIASAEIAPAKMTLAEVRAKLDGKTGRRFWKNLDELADTPAFHELMREEFPRQAGSMSGTSEWVDSVSRRGFLKVMGASLTLAGLAGCTKQPDEPIFPYVKQPEDLVLGKPMYFATAYPFPTGAIPVLVKSDSFRPIKVDGNPEHPMSKGKSDAFTQATLLDLYDPDRSQHVLHRGEVSRMGRVSGGVFDCGEEDEWRAGNLFPERDDYVAVAGGAVEAGAGGLSAGEAGAVGAGESGLFARGFEGGVWQLHGCAVQAGRGGCHSFARCGFPGWDCASGVPAAGGGICGAASVRRRQDDEPAVRRRDDADGDGVQGGASAGVEAE